MESGEAELPRACSMEGRLGLIATAGPPKLLICLMFSRGFWTSRSRATNRYSGVLGRTVKALAITGLKEG